MGMGTKSHATMRKSIQYKECQSFTGIPHAG